LGTVDEYNPRKVISWLRSLVEGVAQLVTTETSSLYPILEPSKSK